MNLKADPNLKIKGVIFLTNENWKLAVRVMSMNASKFVVEAQGTEMGGITKEHTHTTLRDAVMQALDIIGA